MPRDDRDLPGAGVAPLHPALPDRLPLHLTDKALGLWVIYWSARFLFCTWLGISYFNTIPDELESGARRWRDRMQALIRIICAGVAALAVIAL
jgi:ABC-type maltose transport system permease subunit